MLDPYCLNIRYSFRAWSSARRLATHVLTVAIAMQTLFVIIAAGVSAEGTLPISNQCRLRLGTAGSFNVAHVAKNSTQRDKPRRSDDDISAHKRIQRNVLKLKLQTRMGAALTMARQCALSLDCLALAHVAPACAHPMLQHCEQNKICNINIYNNVTDRCHGLTNPEHAYAHA